jgi:acetolactate synthase-1/2/3 large subunit
MAVHGGRVVAHALRASGVERVFTFPGLEIQHVYDGCADEGIDVISLRQPRTAGHAADATARLSALAGVVVLGAGAGITGVVTALTTAYHARSPLVCIGGAAPLAERHRGSPAELDQVELLRPVTKWSASVPHVSRLEELVVAAFEQAQRGVPGPVFLEVPIDVLEAEFSDDALARGTMPGTAPAYAPDSVAVELAAKVLAGAERPLLVAGSALARAQDRDALGRFLAIVPLPVALDGMARGALPPDHPCLFAKARDVAIGKSDVLVLVGRPRVALGALAPGAKVIEIDVEPGSLGIGSAVEHAIAAHVDLGLGALAAASEKRPIDPWIASLRAVEDERARALAEAAKSDESPIRPARLFREVARYVDQRTIVIADGGDIVRAAEATLPVRWPGTWLDAGPLGTLGVGPGFAIAAKLARPDAKVVVVYGDGAFGIGAIDWETMARLGLGIVGVIGNDAGWSQARRMERERFGRERSIATTLSYTRYDAMAEALGGHGFWAETPEQLSRALERAFSSDGPALVNVKTGDAS